MEHTYSLSATVKGCRTLKVEFESGSEIHGVRISEGNGQLRFSMELVGEDDLKVMEEAKKRMESVALAMAVDFGTPLIVEGLKIESKRSNGTIELFEYATLKCEALVTLKPTRERLAKTSELAEKLSSLDPSRREALSRVYRWYARALFDDDSVDRFIQLYVALEVIGSFSFPDLNPTKRVRSVLERRLDKKMANRIISLRSALLHEGKKEEQLAELNPRLTETILEFMRQIAVV